MTAGPGRPLRVEQGLRLVPDVDALAPLRALILSASQTPHGEFSESVGPYLTVGKRALWPLDVRRKSRDVLDKFTSHITSLYDAVFDALEARQRGDAPTAAAALLAAGEREESVGRVEHARAWYEQALALAEEVGDRPLAADALYRLGHVHAVCTRYGEATRCYEQSLALADEQVQPKQAIRALQGLGRVARTLGRWAEAGAWLTRALDLAVHASDRLAEGRLHHDLAPVASGTGNLPAADKHLELARTVFQELGATEDLAFALNTRGLFDASRGKREEALRAYHEALAQLQEFPGHNLWLEVSIRVHLAELVTELGGVSQAAVQLRAAEEVAIGFGFERGLAQVYTAMGKLSGHAGDEHAFVFFEKALELCNRPVAAPGAEANVRFEYGLFRARLGELTESRAHLERGATLLRAIGGGPELARVERELSKLAG